MQGRLYDLGSFDIPGVASQRRIRAYVHPRRSSRPSPRPLLVVFDGQNVFGDEGSYAGGWYLHHAIDRYAKRRARPPVVIAIDHGNDARIDELAPFHDGVRGGKAEALIGWVASVLVPGLRGELDLVTTPQGTVLAGSSLGGLAAMYGHFKFPETFGGVIAMSPSFWFAGRRIFEFVGQQATPWTSKVYLDAGRREMRGAAVQMTTEMAKHLVGRGYGSDRLKLRDDPRGGHDERAWRRRLPGALRFMFG
ncbi:MAG: alpha/beta hydrolase [Polyangiales bacterium]